jgi:hypothetical protein
MDISRDETRNFLNRAPDEYTPKIKSGKTVAAPIALIFAMNLGIKSSRTFLAEKSPHIKETSG